jgi:hypothetical protein
MPKAAVHPQGTSCAADFPGTLLPKVTLPPEGWVNEEYIEQEDIPVFITSNNNPTFLWYWIRLTECYHIPLFIYDQSSDFPPLLALLREIDQGGVHYKHVKVFRNKENRGPRFFFEDDMMQKMPRMFAVTDPDLIMRPDLPPNWLQVMAHLTQFMRIKVGSALDVSCTRDMWREPYHVGMTIEDWEKPFWAAKYAPESFPPSLAYMADYGWIGGMDTTLGVYEKDHIMPPAIGVCSGSCQDIGGMRMEGPYAAAHLPWYTFLLESLLPGELQAQYIRGAQLSIGSTIGKMLLRNNIMQGDTARYEPTEWERNFTGPVWKYIATHK